MKVVTLNRIFADKHSTIGFLAVDGLPRLVTLELPWRNNRRNVSCIPTGEYQCQIVFDRFIGNSTPVAETFEVQGVPNRSGILFHCGNSWNDTEGCILLGTRFDGNMIRESRIGFNYFMAMMANQNQFKLKIRDLIVELN